MDLLWGDFDSLCAPSAPATVNLARLEFRFLKKIGDHLLTPVTASDLCF